MSRYACYLLTAEHDTVANSCGRSANCAFAPSGKCQQPLHPEVKGNEKDFSCSYVAVLQGQVLLYQNVSADYEYANEILMKSVFQKTTITCRVVSIGVISHFRYGRYLCITWYCQK